MSVIFKDSCWVVHIQIVRMVKFEFPCTFPSGSPCRPSRVSFYTPSVLSLLHSFIMWLMVSSLSPHYYYYYYYYYYYCHYYYWIMLPTFLHTTWENNEFLVSIVYLENIVQSSSQNVAFFLNLFCLSGFFFVFFFNVWHAQTVCFIQGAKVSERNIMNGVSS